MYICIYYILIYNGLDNMYIHVCAYIYIGREISVYTNNDNHSNDNNDDDNGNSNNVHVGHMI